MNKQGVRHHDRSEDDNNAMSSNELPTLNNQSSYQLTSTMQSCEDTDDLLSTNAKSQHSPFSACDRTVFTDNDSNMDYYPTGENNVATLTSTVTMASSGIGSLGSITRTDDSVTDNQQVKVSPVKIDYKSITQPVLTITHFGRDKTFSRLNGIAINKFGEMLVSDQHHNKIMCYDRTLRTCHTVGSSWSSLWSKDASNNFNWPSGLASDKEGHFFVADRYHHCIKEFAIRNTDFEFISKIGSVKGSENGYFNEPRGLAISSKENKMYIADGCNNRIQIFQNRTYHSKFGHAGKGPGEFDIPCSIAISNDDSRLFVSDNRNNRVQIFKKNGHFEQQVVHSELSYPHGICITPDDHFIVSSGGCDCALVFKIRGTDKPEHVTTIKGKCEGVEQFSKPGDIVVTASLHIVIATHSKIVFY